MCTFYISRNVFFKRTFIDKKVMKVSCFICSSAPLWILFCKVAAGIVKHQIRSTKSSSIKLSVFSTPWFVLLTACVLKSKKYPFGQAENLQTKGKTIRTYGTDGRYNQKAVGKAADMVLQIFSQTHPKRGWKGNCRQELRRLQLNIGFRETPERKKI